MLENLLFSLLAFTFEPMNFIFNLKYMIIGMICIIIVMGVLILITTALNKLVPKFTKKDKIELGDTQIPDLFILNYMSSLESIDIKVYIYILFLAKMNAEIDIETLAKKLNLSTQDISFALERLQTEELLIKNSSGYNIVDLKDEEINKSYIPKV